MLLILVVPALEYVLLGMAGFRVALRWRFSEVLGEGVGGWIGRLRSALEEQ